jgi:serine/threonine protein kinase
MTILERLRHPNIIAYYGGGVENGQLYYVMELVRGGTVKELLAGGQALPWRVVVEISRQICSALQFAHNHGVIHRDLKPGNLFLKRSGEVKLGDFGIARDITAADLTDTGLTVGTHAYMAPEQITGDNTISGKADLYALGCCMFEMLTGRKVFDGENFAQLFEQHLRRDPPHVKDSVPNCPEELDAIVYQLLAKSPEDRPFNARQVQAVMLKLDERAVAEAEKAGEIGDVGAEGVADLGRQLLQEQIAGRIWGTPRADVSWLKLALMAAAVVVVIAAAAVMGK